MTIGRYNPNKHRRFLFSAQVMGSGCTQGYSSLEEELVVSGYVMQDEMLRYFECDHLVQPNTITSGMVRGVMRFLKALVFTLLQFFRSIVWDSDGWAFVDVG